MSTIAHNSQEVINRRKGRISSIIVSALLLLFLIIPLLSTLNPPPGQEGILISFGEPDVGNGDEQPFADEEIEEVTEEVTEPVEETPPVTETAEPEATSTDEVADVVTDDNSDISIKKESKEEPKKKPEETTKPVEKPKEEPKKEAKPKEPEKPKKPIITFPGNKNNTSQGKTDKPGDAGINDGNPDSDVLDGDKSTGTGTTGTGEGDIGIGGGLSGRGYKVPSIKNPYNEYGTVVVSVCVDANGQVMANARTTRGTTTTSARLKTLAVQKAKQFKFEKGADEQCGTITIKFKAQ